MIKSIHTENFQGHKKSDLYFDPGVNVIVGQTDCGKSSLFRALRWLVLNRPGGDSFRSHWGGDTSVQLELDSGDLITRFRSNTINAYHLNDADFHAMKTDVPDEISSVLNFSEINYQFQNDPPFLFSKTPGEVALHFNKIARIEQIDSASKQIISRINGIKSDIKVEDRVQAELEERLQAFEFLPKLGIELEVLQGNYARLLQNLKKVAHVAHILEEVHFIEMNIADTTKLVALSDKVDLILSLIVKRDSLSEKRKKLLGFIETYQKVVEVLSRQKQVMRCAFLLREIENLKPQHIMLADKIADLKSYIYTITQLEVTLKSKGIELESLEQEWVINFPEVCPLCKK